MGASDDFDAAVLSEQERNLRHCSIEYQRRTDGTLVVPGYIDLSYKNLTVLPNFSGVIVEGDFFCYNNQLISLKGAPLSVGEDFWCTGNHQLTSLEHCPQHVGNTLGCQENSALRNLEHAPRSFKQIQSPFGDFNSWPEIPDNLAPETKSRYEEDIAREATVLQTPVAVSAPLHLQRRS